MGILLERSEMMRVLKIKKYLDNIPKQEGIHFDKCDACDGRGMVGVHKHQGGFSWNGEWCPVCGGIGYVNLESCKTIAICNSCGGTGGEGSRKCTKCDGKGVIDWVEAIRLGITCIGVKNVGQDI